MMFRPACPGRAAETFRRYRAIAIVLAIVFIGLVAPAIIGASDRRSEAARVANQAIDNAIDRARAILDRQQRGLDLLVAIAASAPDATAQQFLDRAATLAPGIRGAALTDATGMIQLRSAGGLDKGGLDEAALSALGADAAREAADAPDAAMLVTQTLHDGDDGTALVGLARPWRNAGGGFAGVALVAIDPATLAGLDLVRSDRSPLFAEDDMPGAQSIALGDFPLMLRYKPPATQLRGLRGPWPFVAVGAIGGAGLLGLLALLVGRLNTAGREIARRTAVERELRAELAVATTAAGRTDELSRAKSQFFAQVTHELRTPLNAILGFSETIRQEIFGPVANSRYLEYAGLIHDAGAHLLSLINDLLDNARIEAGKMEIVPIRVSAPALARSALDLVELLAERRDIALTTIGLSSCPDLNVDPRAMKQVLVNLLSNAIKYTPMGGRIEMRFAASDDGGGAIAVADTGIGMSAEDMHVAFEPFGRSRALEARRQPGTGLGLALARALVRLHRGDLTLTSRLNIGTTASIILPESAVFAVANPTAKTSAKAAA